MEKVYDSADDNFDENVNIDNIFSKTSAKSKNDFDISPSLSEYPILVIDDDKWMQRIFQQYLSGWGFTVYSAMDPYQGLSSAIKIQPLLIFLDVLMPDLNGDMLLKFLKKMDQTSSLPVIITSANLNKDLLKSTYISGANGFISKPFNQETLLNKIAEVIKPSIYRRMIKDGLIHPHISKKPLL